MQVYKELKLNNIDNNPDFAKNSGLSLAFGFFDGIHIGHQAVIKSAVDYAKKHGTKSAVVTFEDHPCCFFYDVQPKYIIKKEDKIKFLEKEGLDFVYFITFDEYLSMMSASDYLKNFIMKNFSPTAISTGFNHHFGAKKSGDVNYLKEMKNELGYEYFEIEPLLYRDEVVSSTRIRDDLALGNIEAGNKMLGYEYFLKETVMEGQKLGRELGFKTANLVYPEDLVEIGRGVYKVLVEYDGNIFRGVANYGLRPTVNELQKAILEVHILDFDKDIYGEQIKVTFLKKIRDEKRFNSLDELKCQIREDIVDSLR